MSTEIANVLEQLPAEYKARLENGLSRNLHNLSIKAIRLPRIKIGHANQTFSLPNGDVTRVLDCWIISEATFMEMYEKKSNDDDDENNMPICVAISDLVGSRYGDCNKCPNFEWRPNPKYPDKKARACSSVTRLLLGIKGMSQPIELKISQTSHNTFLKTVKEAVATHRVPIFALDFKISLKGKKEGNQEWSLFEFEYDFAIAKNGVDNFKSKFDARAAYSEKYEKYFKDAYALAPYKDTDEARSQTVDEARSQTVDEARSQTVDEARSQTVDAEIVSQQPDSAAEDEDEPLSPDLSDLPF